MAPIGNKYMSLFELFTIDLKILVDVIPYPVLLFMGA
jgi:hypothetical protein